MILTRIPTPARRGWVPLVLVATLLIAMDNVPAVGPDPAANPSNPTVKPFVALTAPSRSAELSSIRPACIERFLVDEGSQVTAGDPLVAFDARVQRIRTELARLKAQSDAAVELKRTRLRQAQQESQRLEGLSDHAASAKERDDARFESEVRKRDYELAVLNHNLAAREYVLQQALLDELTLRAPFGGTITECRREAGEGVEAQEGILVLVQLDPLQILVDVPLEMIHALHPGDEVEIEPTEGFGPRRIGHIQRIARVADGASQRVRVRILIPNRDGYWPAGMKVAVQFSAEAQEARAVNRAPPIRLADEGG